MTIDIVTWRIIKKWCIWSLHLHNFLCLPVFCVFPYKFRPLSHNFWNFIYSYLKLTFGTEEQRNIFAWSECFFHNGLGVTNCYWGNFINQIRCNSQSCLCIGTGACVLFLLHTLPLRVPPSHTTSAAPASSSPSTECTDPPASRNFFLFPIFFLSWSQNSSSSSISSTSLTSWISLIPPSPWYFFRKCLRVSSAPDSHTLVQVTNCYPIV